MFGSDQQQLFLTQQQYQQIARLQEHQRYRMQQQPQQQSQYSRLQYQGRYYNENSTQQSQSQISSSSGMNTQQQTTNQIAQNEQQQNRLSNNNFNQQNFQNHNRGKQNQQQRDYNRERNNHRKNNNRNSNNSMNNNNNNNANGERKKSANTNNNNNNNNSSSNSNNNNRPSMQTGKSENMYYDRKNSMNNGNNNNRSNSNESQHKHVLSTSPTPSLSPHKLVSKATETSKDDLRMMSTIHSYVTAHHSFNNNNNNTMNSVESMADIDTTSTSSQNSLNGGLLIGAGDGMMTKDSGILCADNSSKENSINMWINSSNQYSGGIHNGLSASAEQLNIRVNDHHAIPYRKRPPSANAIPRDYETPLSFDYYASRYYYCDNRVDPPLNLVSNTSWDLVSKQIWERFTLFKQTQQTFSRKIAVWRELHECIKGFQYVQNRSYSRWGIFLVGSTITGFGLETSDMDMCLVMNSASPHFDPRADAIVTLSALKTYLINTCSPFLNYALINAKVPILRFRDSTNTIEIDLNFNNSIGVRNTHLLYCYAQLDWRLRPLVIMVKLWAQFHNINDARNGTISSYSLVLMVIFFLQHAAKPKVLPCLHTMYPEKFEVLHDITTIDMMERLDTNWKTENTKPIGELFLRFLDYYSNFDYNRNAISVRTGNILQIEECRLVRSQKNEPSHWQTLCIEEPFDYTNTARSTYDWDIFKRIKHVFFQSWSKLNETKNVDSLFQEPYFVQNIISQQYNHPPINHQILQEVKYLVQANVQQALNPSILSSVSSKSSAEIAL